MDEITIIFPAKDHRENNTINTAPSDIRRLLYIKNEGRYEVMNLFIITVKSQIGRVSPPAVKVWYEFGYTAG